MKHITYLKTGDAGDSTLATNTGDRPVVIERPIIDEEENKQTSI